MSTAILCCVALLAAGPAPAQVSARVLYGTADETKKADLEPWISKAVVEAGSPIAAPQNGWIVLSGEEQRIHTSTSGGFILHGKATLRNGKYEVEIDGCDGGEIRASVLLKPGQRRVVKLTDYRAPNNVFIALEASISEQAAKRAKELKSNAQSFHLELNYNGDQDKPFYRLVVSVPVVPQLASDPFQHIVQVKEVEAIKVIDHLASRGFLDHAEDLRSKEKLPPPTMPGYSMKVRAGDISLQQELGWGLPMVERLEELSDALPDTGKKSMGFLLARLTGLKKQWQAEKSGLQAAVGREDSRVRFEAEGSTTIISIASKFGIDKATIKRVGKEWPKPILVRLNLGGLESFKAGGKGFAIEWSVLSTGEHESSVSLASGKRVMPIESDSPFYSEVRIVGGEKAFPLRDGYFEILLPARLFEGNPEEITLEWIDFVRN